MEIKTLNNISYAAQAQNTLVSSVSSVSIDSPNSSSQNKSEQASSVSNKKDTYESSKEAQVIQKLKEIDQKVRTHEAQHLAAAGSLAQGVSYDYLTGPDKNSYAVSGSVNIDTKEVEGDPRATVEKMRKIQAAALAPSDPSSQDYAVAQKAQSAEVKAMSEAESISSNASQDKNVNANSATNDSQNDFYSELTNFFSGNEKNNSQGTLSDIISQTYNNPLLSYFQQGNFVNVVA